MFRSGKNFLENNFLEKYGKYSKEYDCIENFGKPSFKLTIHIILGVIFFFIFLSLFYMSKPKKNIKTKKRVSRDNIQMIILVVSIIFLICTLGNVGYFLYLYISCYLPQNSKWFNSLPEDAKKMISQIEFNQKTEDRLRRIETRQNNIENNRNNANNNELDLSFRI